MTEQEKFELYFNLTPRDRIDEGGGAAGYLDYEIDKAWDGWQAKASEVALQALADEGQARDASVYSVAAPVTPSGAAGEAIAKLHAMFSGLGLPDINWAMQQSPACLKVICEAIASQAQEAFDAARKSGEAKK